MTLERFYEQLIPSDFDEFDIDDVLDTELETDSQDSYKMSHWNDSDYEWSYQ